MINLLVLQYSALLTLTILLIIALLNLKDLRVLGKYREPERLPSVSILVPARNEETKIKPCINSLLKQNYPDFEVMTLVDHSTDRTQKILENIAKNNPRLRVLTGKPIPEGWLGKHWACHQLACQAAGELILFTDADTIHAPDALYESVKAMMAEDADLLSAFPKEEAITLAEKILIPFISFGITSILPYRLAKRLKNPLLSITVGQFMLFKKASYEKIGGYSKVKNHVVDDMALGRRIKSHGLNLCLVDGSRHILCRMYNSFEQIVDGFSKNLFGVFNNRIIPYLAMWGWVGFIFLWPLITSLLTIFNIDLMYADPSVVKAAVGISLLLFGIAYYRFQYPVYYVLFYPITLILWVLIAVRSMLLTLRGESEWKGRKIPRPDYSWL